MLNGKTNRDEFWAYERSYFEGYGRLERDGRAPFLMGDMAKMYLALASTLLVCGSDCDAELVLLFLKKFTKVFQLLFHPTTGGPLHRLRGYNTSELAGALLRLLPPSLQSEEAIRRMFLMDQPWLPHVHFTA